MLLIGFCVLDTNGNPISYRDGITFTWQNGRQLASLQTDDNDVSYKYDSNGMRTQKTDNSDTTYYYYDSDKMTKGNNTLAVLLRLRIMAVFGVLKFAP